MKLDKRLKKFVVILNRNGIKLKIEKNEMYQRVYFDANGYDFAFYQGFLYGIGLGEITVLTGLTGFKYYIDTWTS